VVIKGSDRLTIDSAQTTNDGIVAVNADTTAGAALHFTGKFDNFDTIVDNGAGDLIFDGELFNLASIASHDAAGQFAFNGRVYNESNGTILVDNGGVIHFNGTAEGPGSYNIGSGGGTLDFGAAFGSASQDGNIDLTGGDGIVQIDDAANFHGIIHGFSSGDAVRLDQIDFASAFIANDVDNGTVRSVTISDGVHQVLLGFDSGTAFTMVHDTLNPAGLLLVA